MKLFLASSLDKTLSLLLPQLSKSPEQMKVIFIANAADPYKEKWWVEADRKEFLKYKFILDEIDLTKISKDEFAKHLKDADIVHICGGSVFYLAFILRTSGLDDIIIKTVRDGRVIYTGTSAGSIIVSRSIAAFSYDEEEMKDIEKIPDKLGLGLINFGIVPHCNQSETAVEHKKMVDHMIENTDPLVFIQDNQAIWVEDDQFKSFR